MRREEGGCKVVCHHHQQQQQHVQNVARCNAALWVAFRRPLPPPSAILCVSRCLSVCLCPTTRRIGKHFAFFFFVSVPVSDTLPKTGPSCCPSSIVLGPQRCRKRDISSRKTSGRGGRRRVLVLKNQQRTRVV